MLDYYLLQHVVAMVIMIHILAMKHLQLVLQNLMQNQKKKAKYDKGGQKGAAPPRKTDANYFRPGDAIQYWKGGGRNGTQGHSVIVERVKGTIEVDGKTGKVVDINLRYVTLESEEANYLIPNSKSVSGSLKVIK